MKIYFLFSSWCEGRGWRKPQQFFYLPFLLDIKKDKYVVYIVDQTKGKWENRYVNTSMFPSKPWSFDHIGDFTLDIIGHHISNIFWSHLGVIFGEIIMMTDLMGLNI